MRILGLSVTCLLWLSAFAPSAFAQDTSRGEYSGGWRYYHATLNSTVYTVEIKKPNDFPKGWYGDLAFNLSPKFAIVGEAGGTYFRDDFKRTSGSVVTEESAEITFHTFMGGVRVRAPQNARVVPFGQVLFGGEHNTSSDERRLTISGRPSNGTTEAGSSGALLGLDGGVTISAGWVGIRAAAGYARFFSKADSDAFRLSLGAAFRF